MVVRGWPFEGLWRERYCVWVSDTGIYIIVEILCQVYSPLYLSFSPPSAPNSMRGTKQPRLLKAHSVPLIGKLKCSPVIATQRLN